MHDAELDIFVKDFALVLKDLEYWQSSDKSEEDYRERVNAFKDRWFGSNSDAQLKERYDAEVERNAELQQQLDRASAPEYEYRMVRSFCPNSYQSGDELDKFLAAGYEFVRASELVPSQGTKAGYIEYILRRKKRDNDD
jgi:hypothetical protein